MMAPLISEICLGERGDEAREEELTLSSYRVSNKGSTTVKLEVFSEVGGEVDSSTLEVSCSREEGEVESQMLVSWPGGFF